MNHSDAEVAEILTLDLWNEHHYQITATIEFYEVLARNMEKAEQVGDEAALTSALVHTRSLLEFYKPSLDREHPDSVWWITALGHRPTDNIEWQTSLGKEWVQLETWTKPIHVFLAHISWARRSLTLPEPPDKNGQRWPLLELTDLTITILDRYANFVRRNTTLGSDVIAAVEEVHRKTQELWAQRPSA